MPEILSEMKKLKRKRIFLITREWLKAGIIAFFIAVIIKLFIIEAITIPTTSMEKTLLPGDFVFVSKIHYGPRIPMTLLSVPFTNNPNLFLDWVELPYFRLPGLCRIKNNDVVVFNNPMENGKPVDKRTRYVKRCVGLPGDSVRITDGKIYVNNKKLANPEDVTFNYLVITDGKPFDKGIVEKADLTEGGPSNDKNEYVFTLTQETEMKKIIVPEKYYDETLFPLNNRWNIDNYGPVYVPKAGDSVKITLENLPLYERIIVIYEQNSIDTTGDSVYINGKYLEYYRFRMNYYFMVGDNRHNSADSRHWGFVPEDHIIGKGLLTWLSLDKGESFINKIRWERIFRIIE